MGVSFFASDKCYNDEDALRDNILHTFLNSLSLSLYLSISSTSSGSLRLLAHARRNAWTARTELGRRESAQDSAGSVLFTEACLALLKHPQSLEAPLLFLFSSALQQFTLPS